MRRGGVRDLKGFQLIPLKMVLTEVVMDEPVVHAVGLDRVTEWLLKPRPVPVVSAMYTCRS